MPEAPQLAQMLRRRGGDLVLPTLPAARDLTPVKGVPRRLTARTNKSDAAAVRLAARGLRHLRQLRGQLAQVVEAVQRLLGARPAVCAPARQAPMLVELGPA